MKFDEDLLIITSNFPTISLPVVLRIIDSLSDTDRDIVE